MIRRALTYACNVLRGFIRASDHHEAARRFLTSNNAETARAGVYAIEEIDAAHKDPGPLGIGARLAVSPIEAAVLRIMAESTAGPVGVSMKPIGDA